MWLITARLSAELSSEKWHTLYARTHETATMIYDLKSAAGMVECRMPLFQFFASCHIPQQHKLPVIQLKSTCSCTYSTHQV